MTTWTTHPVTEGRFDDFADVINPNRRATHCWCLSHRLRVKDIDALGDGSRESAARALAAGRSTFGVVTYRDDYRSGGATSPRGTRSLASSRRS